MKIRSGFVSNSSSSSFIVFGHKISNPEKAIKENKKVLVHIAGAGTSGDAEDWAMFLDKESYDILKEHEWFKRNSGYATYVECTDAPDVDYRDDTININSDIDGEEVFFFDRDYSSPDTVKQLKEFLEDLY